MLPRNIVVGVQATHTNVIAIRMFYQTGHFDEYTETTMLKGITLHLDWLYGSGHEGAVVLLPGFAIIW